MPKDVIARLWHVDNNNRATPQDLEQGRPVIQVTWTPCVYQPVKEAYEWNAWRNEWPRGGKMLGGRLVLSAKPR